MQVDYFKTRHHNLVSFFGLLLVGIFLVATNYYFTVVIVYLTILVFDICFILIKMKVFLKLKKGLFISIKLIYLIILLFLITLKSISTLIISNILDALIQPIINYVNATNFSSDILDKFLFIIMFPFLIIMSLLSLYLVVEDILRMLKK